LLQFFQPERVHAHGPWFNFDLHSPSLLPFLLSPLSPLSYINLPLFSLLFYIKEKEGGGRV